MDKLTQDEKAFLAQFEDNFTRAIDAAVGRMYRK